MIVVGGAADPFRIAGLGQPMMQAAPGRTLSTPILTPGQNTAVLVGAGQSNISNFSVAGYTITNPTVVDNFNVYDGVVYQAEERLLGCGIFAIDDGGSFLAPLADKLIDDGIFDRVILVPIGVGGTAVGEWAPGGPCNQMLSIAYKRLVTVGLTPTLWLWHQGENDTQAGTSQSDYATRLAAVINTPRALGDTAPWFISQASYVSGAPSSAVRAAQAAAVNGVDIFAGPDTDTLTGGTNRVADNTHFTLAGSVAAADLAKTAIDAVF